MTPKTKELTDMLKLLLAMLESGACSDVSTERVHSTVKFFLYGSNLNKYNASRYVGLSPSRFDDYIRMGKIPKGTPEAGSHELRWRESDLDRFKQERSKQHFTDRKTTQSIH